MGIVDITNVSKPFFLSTVIFLILILSLLSLGILQLFTKKYKRAVLFAALSVASSIVYVILIRIWLADTM